jgi:predicted nucleic acid-binding protein
VANVLLDTDILVDHLRGHAMLQIDNHVGHVSVITRSELFAGTSATDLIRNLLDPFHELAVDRAVAERAGRIRRETGIRTPDALIAATALVHRLSLVSRNERDFRRVHGLRLRRLR